jgi:hypothetical protein
LLGFLTGVGLGWMYARLGLPRGRDSRLQLVAGLAALGLWGGSWLSALRSAL